MQQRITNRSSRRCHTPAPLARRVAGWLLIGLGLIGLVLPILPGIALLVTGMVLLGPHDPTLRRIAFIIRWMLRRWSRAPHPLLRYWGWAFRRRYGATRLLVRSQTRRFHRGEFGRRDYFAWAMFALMGIAFFTGLMVALHFGINHLSRL